MLIYGVVWSLLEVDNLTPNPGKVGCMVVWKTSMLEWVTQLIYGEFWCMMLGKTIRQLLQLAEPMLI